MCQNSHYVVLTCGRHTLASMLWKKGDLAARMALCSWMSWPCISKAKSAHCPGRTGGSTWASASSHSVLSARNEAPSGGSGGGRCAYAVSRFLMVAFKAT